MIKLKFISDCYHKSKFSCEMNGYIDVVSQDLEELAFMLTRQLFRDVENNQKWKCYIAILKAFQNGIESAFRSSIQEKKDPAEHSSSAGVE